MFKTFIDQYLTFKEEFKKDIIIISRNISRENINKNKLYFNFFASLLRLEASFQTKFELVDSIVWFIHNDKDLKRNAILRLAEFIEDCQYDNLKTKILNILGKEGPSSGSTSLLVRYIYNRIILENATVRAAAITALGEIANQDASLKENIIKLIKRSINDTDNEVRARANLYVNTLEGKEAEENINRNNSLKIFLFNNNVIDIDKLQAVIKYQKDILLASKHIGNELNKTLNNPEAIAKILSYTESETVKTPIIEAKKSSKNIFNFFEDVSKTEKIKDDTNEEYKKTSFYTKLGVPKFITKLTVKFIILII